MNLKEWQRKTLPQLRAYEYGPATLDEVTILAYFFWNDERIETEFDALECSFRCAFRALGRLPAVLVVNRTTPRIESFCASFDIEIQCDERLNDGIRSLNLDCIRNLHNRFKTKHVLLIQTDGVLVKGGIERFLQYDYVGAPWPQDKMTVTKLPYPKFGVGNGGLSLRSKRICRLASRIYALFFCFLPYGWYFYEDLFYCYFVRLLAPLFLKSLNFPSVVEALEFSVEYDISAYETVKPLGFHSSIGLGSFLARWKCDELRIV